MMAASERRGGMLCPYEDSAHDETIPLGFCVHGMDYRQGLTMVICLDTPRNASQWKLQGFRTVLGRTRIETSPANNLSEEPN